MHYLDATTAINNKKYDMDIVSIEDYAIRGTISRELYEHGLANNKSTKKIMDDRVSWVEDTPIRKFKAFLIDRI